MSLRNLLFTSALFTSSLCGTGASSHAADVQSGRLVVNVRPAVAVEAPPTVTTVAIPAGASGEWQAEFMLPASVRIRLAAGTAAHLTFDPHLAQATSGSISLQATVTVNGLPAPVNMGLPATVTLSASGTHALAVGIRLRGDAAAPSGSVPVRLALRSSDGVLTWSGATELRWTTAQ